MSATNAIDENGVKYLYDTIDSEKQDKEQGKGLSTNDYTTAEKNKLAMMTVVTVDTVNHALVLSTYADGNNVSY